MKVPGTNIPFVVLLLFVAAFQGWSLHKLIAPLLAPGHGQPVAMRVEVLPLTVEAENPIDSCSRGSCWMG
jgi:hypothetical protein